MHSWLIVLLTLVFSALFSGLEIAFISANKLKIELDKNKGLFSAKIRNVSPRPTRRDIKRKNTNVLIAYSINALQTSQSKNIVFVYFRPDSRG